MSMFNQPAAPSGGITWADHKGALLLVEPLSFEPQIATAFGSADAIKANVYVLEGSGAGEEYAETLIFPKLLVSQTKNQLGSKVLGRLGQGNQKAGQSPPWLLQEASAADIQLAEKWVQQKQSSSITSAAAPF